MQTLSAVILACVAVTTTQSAVTREKRGLFDFGTSTKGSKSIFGGGLFTSKTGNKLFNTNTKTGGLDLYKSKAGNDTSISEVGAHVVGQEQSFGILGDKIGVDNKIATGGVEAGIGKGFKGMIRGSASENNFHAGSLNIGTKAGTIDTGAGVDLKHGLEGKIAGNGATIRDDRLEGCLSGFCGSVDPTPAINVGRAIFGKII